MRLSIDCGEWAFPLIQPFVLLRPGVRMQKTAKLTRIIHEASAAAVDPGMSAALRSVVFLSVLSSTPAESSHRAGYNAPDAPCIHARLRRLATNLHEYCGLEEYRQGHQSLNRSGANS